MSCSMNDDPGRARAAASHGGLTSTPNDVLGHRRRTERVGRARGGGVGGGVGRGASEASPRSCLLSHAGFVRAKPTPLTPVRS